MSLSSRQLHLFPLCAQLETCTLLIIWQPIYPKALISDWQKLGSKPAEDIVKLSMEASVVSSYTAFVAVDEENSEPVRGALQTWDIRALNLPCRLSEVKLMTSKE